MIVKYDEFYTGRDFDVAGGKLSVPFVVSGAHSENTCMNIALASSAVYRSGLWRQNVTASHDGNGVWKGKIHYGMIQRAVGKWNLSFDTSGGTLHVTHNKAMRAKYGTAARDTRAIGLNDGQLDGCDIIIPALKLTWTFRHEAGVISLGRIKTLASFTGYVNNNAWMSFEPNEMLFLGATGSEGNDTETSVAYSFAASANVTGLTIGSISGIAKKGHDYLDVKWIDGEDTGVDIKTASAVYTHRVYDEANFSTLMGF